MGKGDKKSKRGKIVIGSFGVRRSKKRKKTTPSVKAQKEPKPLKNTAAEAGHPQESVAEAHVSGEAAKKTVKKSVKKVAEGIDEKPKVAKPKKKAEEETPDQPEEAKQD